MNTIKYLFVSLFILTSVSAFSQNAGTVFMKWKLKPNEVISYKTTMEETDTANRKDLSMDGFMKSIGGDSVQADEKKFLRQLRSEMPHPNYITHLTQNKKHVIDIEMFGNDTSFKKRITDTGQSGEGERAIRLMMSKAATGIMLRGAMYEDGTIESFYTVNSQKNLIALFFELPGHAVKAGDSWPLDVNLLTMDQSFKCDSSYKKNMVTLVKIENQNNEQIVTLKYDILEYISGAFNSPMDNSTQKQTMKMGFSGVASFSMEKGRWVAYDGILYTDNSGAMASRNKQRISLVEEKSK